MKAKLLSLISMLAVAVPANAADSVTLTQLPPAVKKTLDASSRGDPVKEIKIKNENGRTVYDVEFDRKNAPNPHLHIAENGELLRDTVTTTTPPDGPVVYPEYIGATTTLPRLRLDELPRAAQATIEREAAGREIAVITSQMMEGRKVFTAQFREPGRNPRVYVAEDGSVVRPAEKPPVLGVGTTFTDLPTAVQETLRRETRDGEIMKIDKESPRGEPAQYRVEIKDSGGVHQLRIGTDGRVLENTRPTERSSNRG